MKHATSLEVFMGGEHVGTLVVDAKGKIWFAYGKEWSAHGFGLSPMRPFSPASAGALGTSAFKSKNDYFDGLHGVFNDSLPDGWGLLLMDRVLEEKLAWERHAITPLDRLSYIGGRAMGALEYWPAMAFDEGSEEPVLSSLAEAALSVQEGSAGKILESLRIQGGSPGGARPKVTVALNKDGTKCMSGFSSIPADFDHWIVKFRAEKHDPPCIGRIEKAYAEMASQAGITMPETRLVTVRVRGKPQDLFAVKRFDREGNAKRHVVTLGGMMDASHRVPCMSYNDMLAAVSHVTKDVREVEKAFRLMLFNMLAHNKDDHVKNFAFIRNESGWVLSPAYDLTFSDGMNNQHMMSIRGSDSPSLSAIHGLAEKSGVADCDEMLRRAHDAVSGWPSVAEAHGVAKRLANDYGRRMRNGSLRKELDSLYAVRNTRAGRKGPESGPTI